MTLHTTAIVTLLALIVYFWMAARVARTRTVLGILPPAMTGDAGLERTLRAHANTLEWLPIFLPSLWLFAVYWGDVPAAIVGLVWIAGRIVYFLGYVGEARRRFPGFFIQSTAAAVLLFGALGRAIFLAASQG
jgi:uncharacterized membrane protein YecN with MAPEG domain